MSVVAVRINEDHIEIAADSILVRGWTQEKKEGSKLFQEGALTIGGVGLSQDISLLRLFAKRNSPPESTEEGILEFLVDFLRWGKERDHNLQVTSEFLICYLGRVFRVENLYVTEVRDWDAIGAGMDFAGAALHLGHSAEDACTVACELSVMCERPVNSFRIPISVLSTPQVENGGTGS